METLCDGLSADQRQLFYSSALYTDFMWHRHQAKVEHVLKMECKAAEEVTARTRTLDRGQFSISNKDSKRHLISDI